MQRAATAWGVTRNDLLLALLIRSLVPVVGRGDGGRRREIAVASIVNLRRDFGTPVRATFGQFLSSFRVAHPVPAGIALEALARDVHVQTARVRRRKLYLQTLVALAGVGRALAAVHAGAPCARLRQELPGLGGAHDAQRRRALARGGRRSSAVRSICAAVSTGPLAPLVLAATTAGNGLHLGISYRTAAFDATTSLE